MIYLEKNCLGKKLAAWAKFSGEDLWVLVNGGDLDHIGSLSLGLPRPSLTGDASPRATVSTFNVTGHKDDAVGNMFADRLASAFGCRVSVSCGIHFNGLDPENLPEVISAAEALLTALENALRTEGDSGPPKPCPR